MGKTLINIILLLALLFFADNAYNARFSPTDLADFEVKKIPFAASDSPLVSDATLKAEVARSLKDYSMIHEMNLFRPAREEYVPPEIVVIEPVVAEPVAPQITMPDLILHGVMKLGDESIALMEDLKLPPEIAGGKKYKVGDKIHGFTIDEIYNTKVVIKKDDVKFDVMLYDKKLAKPSAKKRVEPPKYMRDTQENAEPQGDGSNTEEPPKTEKKLDVIKRIFGTRGRPGK